MKKILFVSALMVGCVGFTGCESVSSMTDRMGERFSPETQGVTQVFAGKQREVHAAAKKALETLGFRITRTGPAQGIIDAVSGLQSDAALRSSRQLTLKVRMFEVGEGVQVRAAISEVYEEDSSRSPGMGTETPLLDTPLYTVFFRTLGKNLEAAAAAAAAPAPQSPASAK